MFEVGKKAQVAKGPLKGMYVEIVHVDELYPLKVWGTHPSYKKRLLFHAEDLTEPGAVLGADLV